MFDWIPVAQCVLYTLVLLFGLMVSVPAGITKEQFDGECILYGRIDGSTGWVKSGDVTNCNFLIYMHVVLSALLGGIFTAIFVFILISEVRGSIIMIRCNFFVVTGMLVMHILVAFLAFVAACLATVGLRRFCEKVEESRMFHTCADAQHWRQWPGHINGNHFYDNMSMAMIASWCSVATWVCLIALSTYMLVRIKMGTYPPGMQRSNISHTRSSGSLSTISHTKSGSQRSFTMA